MISVVYWWPAHALVRFSELSGSCELADADLGRYDWSSLGKYA